jgi:hypothetical protein
VAFDLDRSPSHHGDTGTEAQGQEKVDHRRSVRSRVVERFLPEIDQYPTARRGNPRR